MKTIHGYNVAGAISGLVVVSVQEGERLRRKALIADKSRLKYGFKPFVNPETYTDEEQQIMTGDNYD